MIDLSLQKITISTSVGIFYPQIETFETMASATAAYDTWTYAEQDSMNTLIFQLMIFPFNEFTSINRKYQSLSELVAQLGGILHILVMIGAVIVKLELRYKRTIYFSEKLYIFEQPKKKREDGPSLTYMTNSNVIQLTKIPSNSKITQNNLNIVKDEVIPKTSVNKEEYKIRMSPIIKRKILDDEEVDINLENLENPLPNIIKREESSKNEKNLNTKKSVIDNM